MGFEQNSLLASITGWGVNFGWMGVKVGCIGVTLMGVGWGYFLGVLTGASSSPGIQSVSSLSRRLRLLLGRSSCVNKYKKIKLAYTKSLAHFLQGFWQSHPILTYIQRKQLLKTPGPDSLPCIMYLKQMLANVKLTIKVQLGIWLLPIHTGPWHLKVVINKYCVISKISLGAYFREEH